MLIRSRATHPSPRASIFSGPPGLHPGLATAPRRDAMQPLLDGTGHVRENVVGIAAYQSYGADHNHQNHRQHHCIFSDVLTLVFMPQITHDTHHGVAFLFEPGSPSQAVWSGGVLTRSTSTGWGKAAGIK